MIMENRKRVSQHKQSIKSKFGTVRTVPIDYGLSPGHCYKALLAHDGRFDGLFFTAVKTTGIYCRPVCRVRAPKQENCTFYKTAAAAEAAGYRPCLRCRPELAPGYAETEQGDELLSQALAYIETCGYAPKSIAITSLYLGITPRHLSRIFQNAIGVSPQQYMMTKRLLLAKSLLTDTDLSISEISETVGFGSLSRFNAAFKDHYKLVPSALRKGKERGRSNLEYLPNKTPLILKLSYRPPYDWPRQLAFFKARAIDGVEEVTEDGAYRRALQMEFDNQNYSGWIEVRPQALENLVVLSVSRSLLPVLTQVIARVRLVFDLDLNPQELPPTLPEGIRLPGCFDAFEMGTRAILGQQITVQAARTLALRIVKNFGKAVETPWPTINALFPTAKDLIALVGQGEASDLLGPLGIIKSRSKAIYGLAGALSRAPEEGGIGLYPKSNRTPATIKAQLMALPGIGPWTAEYLSMRALSWPDAFPETDIGIRNALDALLFSQEDRDELICVSKSEKGKRMAQAALNYAEAYRPWRSYLTIALWNSLSEG